MDHLVDFLLIGLVAGWLAGKIMKGSGFGLVGDLVLGVMGAYIGGFFLPARRGGLWHDRSSGDGDDGSYRASRSQRGDMKGLTLGS